MVLGWIQCWGLSVWCLHVLSLFIWGSLWVLLLSPIVQRHASEDWLIGVEFIFTYIVTWLWETIKCCINEVVDAVPVIIKFRHKQKTCACILQCASCPGEKSRSNSRAWHLSTLSSSTASSYVCSWSPSLSQCKVAKKFTKLTFISIKMFSLNHRSFLSFCPFTPSAMQV